MPSTDFETETNISLAMPHASLAERFSLSDEQTLELILSIITAVQAGIDGEPELRDQLIRDTEKRFAYPRATIN
jgi:hypothetical protein